jgi:ribulose-phosphate 3-epimerase
MAINPGIPKHPFIPETLDKLVGLRRLISQNNSTSRIGIDGGVTFQNAVTLFDNGADILICGSGTIFKADETLESNLISLTTLINESY